MLVNIFLQIFYSFVGFVIGLLPVTGFSSTVTTSISGFFTSVYAYDSIFPIDTVETVIGLVAVFWGLVVLFKMVKWIIHLIRGN